MPVAASYFASFFSLACALLVLGACAPAPPQLSPGHIQAEVRPRPGDIPPPVTQAPYVPEPAPAQPLEMYTVVVDKVPVRELLFALARDARMDVDIYPGVEGSITLNAVDQTLPQILQRIARQINLRYKIEDNNLLIMPDSPHVRHYQINYVNMDRDSTNRISIETQVAASSIDNTDNGTGGTGGSSGGNNSTTQITSASKNNFWESLAENVKTILAAAPATSNDAQVVAHRESGLLTVRATSRQHEAVQAFLDQVMRNVQRQVMIEATIVEIHLSDRYQAGVDWQRIAGDFTYEQGTLGGNFGGEAGYYFGYVNPLSRIGNISAALRLLQEFGNVKVLSSPKIMALNNQTAILKVVDNRVYFTVNVKSTDATPNSAGRTDYESMVRTVPEGLLINVTPHISENDTVMLNIRPTILRIVGFVNDPNPSLAQVRASNPIPEMQVREIESMLKVRSGNVAIIGGLMQDSIGQDKKGIPGLSKLPLIGDAFSYRDDQYRKTELAIFLRPVVIKDADLNTDMKPYRVFLPDSAPDAAPYTSLPLNPEAYYRDSVPRHLLDTQ
jgi:MSHA biogenesis protein MshL